MGCGGCLANGATVTDSYGRAAVNGGQGYDWYGQIEPRKTFTLNHSYYSSDGAVSRFSDSGRTNEELKVGLPTSATDTNPIFVDWDIDVWGFGEDDEYPDLEGNAELLLPGPPTNVTATPGDRHLSVRWEGGSGASKYKVLWKPTTDTAWEQEMVDTKNIVITNLSNGVDYKVKVCLLYTSPSPRDRTRSRMPSSA